MRNLLRTTMVTTIVVFSALMIWSFLRNSNTAQDAQAAAGTSIPAHCVADYQERMAKVKNEKGRQAALQAEMQCAAEAQGYPSRKKTALAKAPPPRFAPTTTLEPTPTLRVGIQHANLGSIPQTRFMPKEDGYNFWGDFVNGQVVQIAAGYVNDPDWQDHPTWAIQGALRVTQNYEWIKSKIYSTPTRHGEVHFIAACDTMVFIRATDGTVFAFDVAALSYLDTVPACSTVTP